MPQLPGGQTPDSDGMPQKAMSQPTGGKSRRGRASRRTPDRPPLFAQVLERYRVASGKSWEEVDEAADVRPDTRRQWLRGTIKNPPLEGVLRLAHVLGVPDGELTAAVVGGDVLADVAAQRAELEARVAALEAAFAALSEEHQELLRRTSAGKQFLDLIRRAEQMDLEDQVPTLVAPHRDGRSSPRPGAAASGGSTE